MTVTPPEQKLEKIIQSMRYAITRGDYGRYQLPQRSELIRMFHTTRETINKAITRLQAEGLILYQKGSRLSLEAPKTRIPGVVESFDGFIREQGLEPDIRDLEPPNEEALSYDLAQAFRVPELTVGTPVIRRLRLQGSTITPYRIAETIYLRALVDDETYNQMRQDPYFIGTNAIYEKYGKYITKVHEESRVRFPSQDEQHLLNIVPGSPVTEIYRICRSEDGTIIMANHLILVSVFFVFSYDYTTSTWENKYH